MGSLVRVPPLPSSVLPSILPFFPFAGSALFPCAGSALVRCAGSALVPCAGSARVLGAGSAPCQLPGLSLHLRGLPALPWHRLRALPSSFLPFPLTRAGSGLVPFAVYELVSSCREGPLRGFRALPFTRVLSPSLARAPPFPGTSFTPFLRLSFLSDLGAWNS